MKSSLHRIEIVRLALTPVELAKACCHLPGFIFFDSALAGSGEGQKSIIAACPEQTVSGHSEEEWALLKQKLADYQASNKASQADIPTPYQKLGIPLGMAAGFIEYEGEFTFGFYPGLLVFDHSTQTWLRIGQVPWAEEVIPYCSHCESGERSSCDAMAEKPITRERIPPASRSSALQKCGPPSRDLRPSFRPTLSREEFCQMVRCAKEYIAAGDIYQVNLSQKFTGRWESDCWRFYEMLRLHSAAPHAAYLALGSKTILSSSPELFLRISGAHIVTKPIKGTRPRFADPSADAQSAHELITSKKEMAELVMITDLERNDLGKSCQFGSVSVTELLKLERFAQVFHLISTVEGELRPEVDHPSALRSCFPGGSITGAPKKRAMEIIAELEPVARGVYTGAIGYFGFNQESQFNIAIRTAVVEGDTAHFHVGAGIVADSDPGFEFEETLHKAAGILLAAKQM